MIWLLLTSGTLFLLLTLTPGQGADYCRAVTSPLPREAQARVALLISLRKSSDTGQCGVITGESLLLALSLRWAVQLLNQGLFGNASFVPGIKLGLELYDDCRNPLIAASNGLDLLRSSLPPQISHCDSSTTTSFLLGALGPSRSSTAQALMTTLAMNGTWGMPVLSPSATLTGLTNRSDYPITFLRTVPPDSLQARAMVSVLKKLRWNYVAGVYTDDAYGRQGMEELRKAAAQVGLCVLRTLSVTDTLSLESVVRDLVSEKRNTLNGTLGIVYFGHSDNVKHLMFYVKSFIPDNPGLHWLMSEAVGANFAAMQDGAGVAFGTLTIATSHERLQAAQDFYASTLRDVDAGRANDSLVSSYLNYYLDELGRTVEQAIIQQTSYVPLVIDALYAYAVALRNAHRELCRGVAGICSSLERALKGFNFSQYLTSVNVNYTEITEEFAPREFVQNKRMFHFENGEIVRTDSSPAYVINSYQPTSQDNMHFVEVGNVTTAGEVTLDLNKVVMRSGIGSFTSGSMLPWSTCLGSCNVCHSDVSTATAFLPGDVYLVGIFSLHEANGTNPYQCGAFRSIAMDTIYLEGFLSSIRQLRQQTGINFGALVFDDCYSAVRVTALLSQYFNPSRAEENKQMFGRAISRSQVLGVVGGLSSDVTLQVARFFTHLPLPVVSYASSTPDLDDRVVFPLFLRTVPSDKLQAEAMAAVVAALGWKYVGLLYVDNNYGNKGKEAFVQAATALGVCVAAPLPIPASTPASTDILYDTHNQLLAQAVSVVVFFGIDTRISEFLGVLNKNKLVFLGSEDWGDNSQILRDHGPKVMGAITFKLQSVQNPYQGALTSTLAGTGTLGQGNPWFSEYLQNLHSCNLREGFINTFSRVCQEPLAMTPDDISKATADQRLSHVMNAVLAVGKGFDQFRRANCDGRSPCPKAFQTEFLSTLVTAIREVQLYDNTPGYPIFNQEGNGAIGFEILNIQSVSGVPQYVKVGSYSANGQLSLPVESLKFYDELGNKVSVTAACTEQRCSGCTPFNPSPSPSGPATLPPPAAQESDFRPADAVILAVVLLVLLVLTVALVLYCCYFRRKLLELAREADKAREEDPVYQAVSDRVVYQYGNIPDVTRGIRFDNVPSSQSPSRLSPAITQGYSNPAFQDPYSTESGRLRSTGSAHSSSLLAETRPPAELPPLGGASSSESSGGERPRTLPIMSVTQLQQLQQQQQRQQQEQFLQQQLLFQEHLRLQELMRQQQQQLSTPLANPQLSPSPVSPLQQRSPSLTAQDPLPMSAAPSLPSPTPGSPGAQEQMLVAQALFPPSRSLSPAQEIRQEIMQLDMRESPRNPRRAGSSGPPSEAVPTPPREESPVRRLSGLATTISRV